MQYKSLMRFFFSLFFYIVLLTPVTAQWLPDANSEAAIKSGVSLVYNLEFKKATAEFQKVAQAHPTHPAGHFFLAMVDWWRIVTDLESHAYDERFLKKLDDVIDLCDERLDKNENDLAAVFFKGGALGFQGRLHGNREDWVKAANAGRQALPLVRKAYELDPKNNDVLFGIGIYNYYAAVVPEQYPFVKPFMMFFPEGNKEKGLKQLRQSAEKASYANIEATYFLLQILFNFERQYGESLQLADRLYRQFPNNVIFHKYVGRCYAALGQWEQTHNVFSEILTAVSQKKPGYDPRTEREAEYYLGLERLQAYQLDEALKRFYRCDELSRNLDKEEFTGFMVMANLKIGMIYDLQKKRNLAVDQYKKVLQMKDYQSAHEQAERYMKNPYSKS